MPIHAIPPIHPSQLVRIIFRGGPRNPLREESHTPPISANPFPIVIAPFPTVDSIF
jgi:hypothetical protein